MKNIIIFASGSGSNAEKIMQHFENHSSVRVAKIYTNNPKAGVIERAQKFNIDSRIFSREEFIKSDIIVNELIDIEADLIVLAGFLWLIPENIIEAFPDRIINIHPALLPNYGGKGMYGENVHKAVHSAGESESGITIHLVNTKYDEGKILFQEKINLSDAKTPEEIAQKVLTLEHKYFSQVIEKYLREIVSGKN